ncbi:MAG: CrcB family protein [Planctomycetes bacterium]|nr:CrcB family protein [Planctomycetota bacterium]
MKELLLVCLGGAFGSGMRYGTDRALLHWLPERAAAFPWATLLVNSVGCFAIGLGTAMLTASQGESANSWRLFLLVGLCGGLTTFSAFAMQSIELAPGKAFLNVGLSVILGFGLAYLGLRLGSR